ncbi:MAG TPA: hypothetical protein VKV16_03470 [Solirubrobacteraceae bacterium]|nr:hypothetical protein [Solirubrobacteraceae bacterium]
MAALKRGRGGRITSSWDLRTLLDAVAAVARAANPEEPHLTRQVDYDAARASAGYPDVPTGKQTAQRFGLAWRELLVLALDESRDRDKAVGYLAAEPEDDSLDESGVRLALRTIALRLGKRTLTGLEYRRERAEMLAAASLHRHPIELSLPSEWQILRAAGSWDAALEIAGFERGPAPRAPKGLALVDALELALEAIGCLPTRNELERFAAANRLSIAKGRRGYAKELAELRARRADWGKWTPQAPPPPGQRPDWRVQVELPGNVPLVERRKREWTRDECIAAIRRLLAELGSERLTQRVYQQKAAGRRDLPALPSVQRHGRFIELVAEARQQRSDSS